MVNKKRNARKNGTNRANGYHYLVLCEHHPVYTLGKSGKEGHLLVGRDYLSDQGISFYKINRGGDITYHGPGQLVVYPILDLEFFFTDIHRYIRTLEEVVIRTMDSFGLKGHRIDRYTGVWTGQNPERKICAIGVHMSRWVSMHGLAFNINPNLSYFDNIVPCGIDQPGLTVTSMSRETGRAISMDDVKKAIVYHFSDLFKIHVCENQKSQVNRSQ